MSKSIRLATRRAFFLVALLVLAVLFWLGGRDGFMGLTHHIGYAVCHQIQARTYLFGDLVMPLCARCTGQYLGLWVGLFVAWRLGRLRVWGFPQRKFIVVLLLFLAVWAFDGVNSYLYLLLARPFIYMPHNILRISTGILQGLAISFLFLPFFNQVFGAEPDPTPVLQRWRELFAALGLAALMVLAVNSGWLPLFYPLSFLSAAGVFLFLSLIGLLFLVIITKADNSGRTARDFFMLLVPGMALAALFILGFDLLRGVIEGQAGFILPGA